jgi:hypothetical protein
VSGTTGAYAWLNATTATSDLPPDPARDLAPGLTMKDLDALLREHYAKGYRAGHRKGMDEAGALIPSERRAAAQKAEADLLQWMWPNVMNRVLTASERVAGIIDGPRSTIAKDRERIDVVLGMLKQSLHTFHGKRPNDA